jgi:hypothetical protein
MFSLLECPEDLVFSDFNCERPCTASQIENPLTVFQGRDGPGCYEPCILGISP